MIVIYSENDKDASGNYPLEITMQASTVFAEDGSGKLLVVKDEGTDSDVMDMRNFLHAVAKKDEVRFK